MNDYSDFKSEYNELLSKVTDDLGESFAALASPTLSKQETVTNLYKMVCNRDLGRYPWFDLLLFVPKVIYSLLRMVFVILLVGKTTIPAQAVVFRSWLEPKCVSSDVVIDEHFRKLPDIISSDNTVASLLHPYDYTLILPYHKKIKAANNIFLTITVLGITDVIRLHVDYMLTGLARVCKPYFFRGQDVSQFIKRSLLLDFLKMRSFTAYQEKYIANRIATLNPKSYVYVFENQSWEKVSCSIMHRHGVRAIGVQGSGFSPIFLNFFPTKKDATRSAQCYSSPSVILTVGENFTKKMNAEGCYIVPILTFGALRFDYDNNSQGYIVQAPDTKIYKKILYAFPVHISQYRDIIGDLIDVFGESDIIVDLKFHPQYRFVNLDIILPNNFNIVGNIDQKAFRHTYDFVLFNDNSFGLESLMLGVKSYQYAINGECIDNRFFYFNLWSTCLNKNGLIDLRHQFSDSSLDKMFNVNEVRSFINLTYKADYDLDLFKKWAIN